MSKNITITNGNLTLTVSTQGAEIQSLVKNSKEYIWCGNPDVWSGHAPILFPICGGLKDDKFIYKGKEYVLPKHGFARLSEFEVENQTNTSATFLLKSTPETLNCYPFEFELRTIFELCDDTLNVTYRVTNTGDDKMYFSIGAHEAYACEGGIEDYSVIFEQKEKLDRVLVDGNLMTYNRQLIAENTDKLALKNEYFNLDAIILDDVKSRKVTVKGENKAIDVKFDDHDYLLIWTKPGAEYICIEPWCGIPDYVDSDNDITTKKGIICIDAKESCDRKHTITIL